MKKCAEMAGDRPS